MLQDYKQDLQDSELQLGSSEPREARRVIQKQISNKLTNYVIYYCLSFLINQGKPVQTIIIQGKPIQGNPIQGKFEV